MQFLNALSAWQWAAAAAIPIGVIALYFLKLKRQPLQVPSTFLWQKSVETCTSTRCFSGCEEFAAFSAALDLRARAIGTAPSGLVRQSIGRPAACARDRQFGEHVGYRRRTKSAGVCEAASDQRSHRQDGGR